MRPSPKKTRGYVQVYDGDTFSVPSDGIEAMACCDCGLVHIYKSAIIITGKKYNAVPYKKFMALMKDLKMRQVRTTWRDPKRTSNRRRVRKVRDKIAALASNLRA